MPATGFQRSVWGIPATARTASGQMAKQPNSDRVAKGQYQLCLRDYVEVLTVERHVHPITASKCSRSLRRWPGGLFAKGSLQTHLTEDMSAANVKLTTRSWC